jgi:subtilisin family serine protease
MTDSQGRVEVTVTCTDPTTLAPILTSAGMNVVSVLPQYHRVEGYIPWSALPAVSGLAGQGLMGILGVPNLLNGVGSVTSEGVNVMEADRVQASTPGYSGTGVKVGVLSDSYNLLGGAATDVSTGDLPTGVQVIQEGSSGFDEGRALMQVVHDVAPGSPLAFATAHGGDGNFAANIQKLADAGAKVIVDDVVYLDEPFFQPGIIANAVNNVVAGGVSYFAAAGNYDTQAYDTASPASYGSSALNFVTDTIPNVGTGSFFDFDPSAGVNDRMTFTIPQGSGIILSFQWDQPFYTTNGVTTDVDIYLINHTTGKVVAHGFADSIANQTPLEFLGFQNKGSTAQFDIVINNYTGPNPGEMKFVNYGANSFGDTDFGTFATNSGTVIPHVADANAMAVGAVPFFGQRTPEYYSSWGPSTLLFDASGNRLASPRTVAKPDLMAPDGVSTTFFFDGNINGFPNFYGTSAAAPHAAGVAALILQANPSDTPAQVYSVMKSTADRHIGSGNVDQVGSGLVDAYRAVFGGPVPAYANTADGFESGALSSQWQVYTTDAGRVQVSSGNGPSSGTHHLVLDGNADGYMFGQLDEAILNVNLAGRTNVTLSFDQAFFNSLGVPVVSMPATFTGHNNSNGVAFSGDGTHWYRITSLGSTSSTPYQTDSFNLSQIAAGYGVTLGANTLIKFQESNAESLFAPGLALAIDNVKVGALSVLAQSQIDTGTAQRSAVRSITLTFQGDVTTLPASAFTLRRNEDGLVIPVNVGAPVYTGGLTTVVLTFGGPHLNGTSLPDGRYTLTIDGRQILDDFGNQVDAAKNGTAGSTGTLNFFRFFGDSNGDGRVDATDYLAFRAAYLSGVVTPANSFFDLNGDGRFTIADLEAFARNFILSLLLSRWSSGRD